MTAFAVIVCWRAGKLQALELAGYDLCIRQRSGKADHIAERVVIVGATEEDVREFGWPLADDQLAGFLLGIARFQPRVIGLDVYRDLPEPRTGEYSAEFRAALEAHPEIIAIYNVDSAIDPPEALANCPDRIGFNDLPADPSKVVRRGLLFMQTDRNHESVPSFAFQIVRRFLEKEAVHPASDSIRPENLRLGEAVVRPFEANDGAYVGGDAGGYQFLLDFKRSKFRVLSLRAVHEGRIDPEWLRDRVVLVGVTAESVHDLVRTPSSKVMHGVELHAQVIDQILRMALDGHTPVGILADWIEAAWIVFWAVLGAMVGHRLRTPVYFVAAALSGMGALVAVFWIAFACGFWVPVGAPALAFIPVLGLATSYQVYREKSERTILMHLFSRHVSKDIAEALWHEREIHSPRGLRCWKTSVATVLFSDLRGFSSVSEQMDPQLLAEWINQYLDRMAGVVAAHHGVINKFIGDAIMAVFGIPAVRTTRDEMQRDALDAVRCALSMGRALAGLNERWGEQRLPSASMRVGIFTGPVVAGCVGNAERMEFTVIGDTVNTAARLESFGRESDRAELPNERCRILIGETTRWLVNDIFELNFLGSVPVKGKAEPVAMYRVLGEQRGCEFSSRLVIAALLSAGLISNSLRAETQKERESRGMKSQSLRPRAADRKTLRVAPPQSGNRPDASGSATNRVPIYQPPRRGAPRVRVNAGSRGIADFPTLTAFAPEHAGLTTREQPSLFWHFHRSALRPLRQGARSEETLEFALVLEEETEPVLQLRIKTDDGIGRVALSDYGIKLAVGSCYRWSVALVLDPASRSKDVVSSGMIQRVEPPEIVKNRLKRADALERAIAFAESGFWYDSMEELLAALAAEPKNGQLISALNSLLKQADLPEVSNLMISR